MLALPGVARAQDRVVESDPAVVGLLPRGYPLNRVRVDAQRYPWSAVGRLTLHGGRSSCTGALVSERHVITAAHCVFSRRDAPEQVNFLAGFQQDHFVAHARAVRIEVCDGFAPGRPSLRTLSRDCAVIELDRPIGRTAGYLGWALFDPAVHLRLEGEGVVFKLSGYRGDRLLAQTVDHDCRIEGFVADGQVVTHACPITGGDSGGPILLSVNGELLVVGVDVGVRAASDPSSRSVVKRTGLAVPTLSFRRELERLGGGAATIERLPGLVGRPGRYPQAEDRGRDPP